MRPNKKSIERITSITTGFFAFNAVYSESSSFGPHTHEDHEVNVVVQGEAWYEHESFGRARMREGEILLLPGGVPHRLVVPEAVTFRCFVISLDAIQTLAANTQKQAEYARYCSPEKPLPVRVVRDHGQSESWEELYRQYLAEHAAPDEWTDVYSRRLGELAAMQFLRLMESPNVRPPTDAESRVAVVRHWIDRHFPEQVSLADLGEMASLSPSHFSMLFRAMTGMAPMAYLYRRRLDHAAILLARTSRPVSTIGWSVGYENLEHFSRAFHAYAGISPKAFRKKHQV